MATDTSAPVNRSQLMACPKCGALNSLTVSHCYNCGEYLPPPIDHPSYRPMVPAAEPKEGLSVPMILLIISVILLVAMAALFLLAFMSWG